MLLLLAWVLALVKSGTLLLVKILGDEVIQSPIYCFMFCLLLQKGGFHTRKGSFKVAGISNIMIPPITDSFCTCLPMMQCLHDIDIDRQRSCARSDSRHRQCAPHGASCLSFFYRIFIIYVIFRAEVFHSTLVMDIR